MHSPLLSIGVPVYNVEKYLQKCLDGLINQTLQDIEIIVVNDGSTDLSGEICKEYEKKDFRIKVINKENGGLASARQAALEVSRGKYFCACDADDWVDPTMYEELYSKAEETAADIVMCGYFSEYPNGEKDTHSYKYKINERKDLLDDALNGNFPCMVWNKIYRRDIFSRYSLSWEPGINLGEDFLLMLKILKFSPRICTIPVSLYHYRRMPGEDSYTNKVTLNSYNQMLRIHDWIVSNINMKQYERGVIHNLINVAFAGLRVEEGMTAEYYKHTSIKKLSIASLLREKSLKALLILWTKIFGYHAGRVIYKLMYRSVYK